MNTLRRWYWTVRGLMNSRAPIGLAIALALDATLARLQLIPAAMRLLGERN